MSATAKRSLNILYSGDPPFGYKCAAESNYSHSIDCPFPGMSLEATREILTIARIDHRLHDTTDSAKVLDILENEDHACTYFTISVRTDGNVTLVNQAYALASRAHTPSLLAMGTEA